jgi:hypothetical protein
MADEAADILARWRTNGVPPEVPREDVARVAAHYFAESYDLGQDIGNLKATKKKRGGSHFLIIREPLLRWADEQGHAAFPGGVITIPHTGGRNVKAVYVRRLMDAIDLRDALAEAHKKKDSET